MIRVSPNPSTFVNGTDFLRNTFDYGHSRGHRDRPARPGRPRHPRSAAELQHERLRGRRLRRLPGRRHRAVQRGTCGFNVKALNAQAAAARVVTAERGPAGPHRPGQHDRRRTGLTIPAVFTTFEAGSNLAATPGAIVTVTVDYVADERQTCNVLAETSHGNDDNVVMAGAHLDSVQEGPASTTTARAAPRCWRPRSRWRR